MSAPRPGSAGRVRPVALGLPVLAALLVAAVAGAGALLLMRDVVRSDVRRSQQSVAVLGAARLAAQFEIQAQGVASAPAVRALTPLIVRAAARPDGPGTARLSARLRSLPARVRGVQAVSVADGQGRVLAVSGRADGSQRPMPIDPEAFTGLRGAVRGRSWATGPAFLGASGPAYTQAIPVRAGRRLVAVMLVESPLAPVTRALPSGPAAGGSDAWLVQPVTGAGQVVAVPAGFRVAAWTRFSRDDRRQIDARALRQGDVYAEDAQDLGGRTVAAATRRVPGTPFVLVVGRDAGAAFAPERRAALIVGGALAAVALAVLVAALIRRSATRRRVRRITAAVESIGQGGHTRIGDTRDDDLGALAAAVDRLGAGVAREDDRRREVERELQYQARQDPLTGLPNRTGLEARLADLLGGAPDARTGVSLLFCDMDGFKSVNDSLGHRAGDELLRAVAGRLRAALRPGDTLTRFGGDEFVAVCATASRGEAEIVAARLQGAVREPIVVDGHAVTTSLSIGIAMSDESSTPESLIQDADVAMYVAKGAGRRRHVVYAPSMREAAGTLASADQLRRLIADGSLTLEYQPIVRLASREVVAVEALVRWRRSGVTLPAADWVERVEELGVGADLDRFVLERAAAQVARWRRHPDSRDLRVTVNLCPGSLRDPGFAAEALGIVAAAGLSADALCVEVGAAAFTHEDAATLANLQALRDAGVEVAVGDFGTEMGALTRLAALPVDSVKLDTSLVATIDRGPMDRDAAAAVIDLARGVGVELVAEGIERFEQREALVALGCVYGQGFHLGRPVPALAGAEEVAA